MMKIIYFSQISEEEKKGGVIYEPFINLNYRTFSGNQAVNDILIIEMLNFNLNIIFLIYFTNPNNKYIAILFLKIKIKKCKIISQLD